MAFFGKDDEIYWLMSSLSGKDGVVFWRIRFGTVSSSVGSFFGENEIVPLQVGTLSGEDGPISL